MPDSKSPPLVDSARREAIAVLTIWLTTMIYTTAYCFHYGQGRTLDNLTFVFGFPDWIFWGVIVPWFVCLAISTGFAFVWIRNDHIADDDAPPGVGDHA